MDLHNFPIKSQFYWIIMGGINMVDWKDYYDVDYYNDNGKTYLIHTEKYGVAEAVYQKGRGAWFVCRENECISEDRVDYIAEMPEFTK